MDPEIRNLWLEPVAPRHLAPRFGPRLVSGSRDPKSVAGARGPLAFGPPAFGPRLVGGSRDPKSVAGACGPPAFGPPAFGPPVLFRVARLQGVISLILLGFSIDFSSMF